MAYLLQN